MSGLLASGSTDSGKSYPVGLYSGTTQSPLLKYLVRATMKFAIIFSAKLFCLYTEKFKRYKYIWLNICLDIEYFLIKDYLD